MCIFSARKKGAALAAVLMLFAVLSILGTTMLSVSLSETRQSVRQGNNMQAYYAARSGADALAAYIMDNPSSVDQIISKTSYVPGKGNFNGVEFELKVIRGVLPGEIIINSKGRAKDGTTADVRLTLMKTNGTTFKNAIFADSSLNLGNNTIVQGDVGTNSANEIGFGNKKTKLNGNLILGPDAVLGADGKYVGVDYACINGTVVKQLQETVLPTIDESKFAETAGDITSSLNFNVEGQKRYIKVGKLDLRGNSSVVVRGKGELHILVTGSIGMGGNSAIQTEGGAKLFLYYKGMEDVDIKGGALFEGAIFAPNAGVEWKGGGNEIIKGSIVAKSFTGASSNTQIIYDESLNTMEYPLIGAGGYERKQWGD